MRVVDPATVLLRHDEESALEKAVHALEPPRRLLLQAQMRRLLQLGPVLSVLPARRHSVSIGPHRLLDLRVESAQERIVKEDSADVRDGSAVRVVPSHEG